MSASKEFIMPETYSRRRLNELYREIPLKDTTSRLLRKYFNAAANLYGIIPLQKLYEIITEQNNTLVTKNEFLTFAKIARHECEGYCILGREELYTNAPKTPLMEYEVIDFALIFEDLEPYYELFRGQQGKPYYVPEKKELLKYSDPLYWEPTGDSVALRNFLLMTLELDDETAGDVFLLLYDNVRCGNAGMQDAIECLNAFDIELKSTREIGKFTELFTAFNNHTRTQYNRGYTPDELIRIIPRDDSNPTSISLGPNIRRMLADGVVDVNEMRLQILTADMPNEAMRMSLLKEIDSIIAPLQKSEKVGRNDPCPCGSGKKYKHCCGK